MKALILAAGIGERLKEFTNTLPKCLLPIGNKTLLERQIEILNSCGIDDITIVIGVKGDCWTQENYNGVKKIIDNIKINFDNISKKRVFTLSIGLKDIKEGPLLIVDSDLFFTKNTLNEIINSKHELVLLSRLAKDKKDSGHQIFAKNGKVTKMGNNIARDSDFPWYMYAGLVKVEKTLFPILKKEINKPENENGSLSRIITTLCSKYNIYTITSKYSWININTYKDLLQARKLIV